MSAVLDYGAIQRAGVQLVPLGELLVDIRNGLVVDQKKEPPGIPITRIETISKGVVDLDRVRYVQDAEGKNLANFWLRTGDILFSHINSDLHLGKTAIVASDAPLLHGMNLLRLRVDVNRLRPKYLHHWFDYCRRTGVFMAIAQHAVNQSSLNQKKITSLKVPLPSISVQERVVSEIELQFSRLDEAVANLQRVKANLKRYKAAVLKAAVEGRLVATDGRWVTAKLGDIALSVRNGYSQKPDAESGSRIFRISAVRSMELNVDDVRYLSGQLPDYEPFYADPGDVLFTRYNGSRDYVGVCAVVPAGLPPTVYPDKLIRVRVPQSILLPGYLVIVASTGEGREFIESKIRTTAGQSGISGSDIRALPLQIPTLSEQYRIIAEVDRHLSLLRGVAAEIDANLRRANGLRSSILATTFGGEPAHA